MMRMDTHEIPIYEYHANDTNGANSYRLVLFVSFVRVSILVSRSVLFVDLHHTSHA